MINTIEFAIGTEVFYITPVPAYELNALCKYHIMKGKIQAFVDLDTVTVGSSTYYSSVVKDWCVAKTKTKLLAQIKEQIRLQVKDLNEKIITYKKNFNRCVQIEREFRRLDND